MLLFVDLVTRLSQANVIIGIILCAIGLAVVLLSKKLGRVFGKNDEDDDSVVKGSRIFGLVVICVAMIVMILY